MATTTIVSTMYLAIIAVLIGAGAALSLNCGSAGDTFAYNGGTVRGRYSVGAGRLLSHAYGPRLEYRFRVAPGKQCFVAAKFAEIYGPNGRAGGRLLSVAIGGQVVRSPFDTYVAAGNSLRKGATVSRRFTAPANGIVSVVVTSVGGDRNAMISAIDIWGGDGGKAYPGYGGGKQPNNNNNNNGGGGAGGTNTRPKMNNNKAKFTFLGAQKGSPTARHENCAVLTNGKIYLIGGRGKKPVDVYDLGTNTWTKRRVPNAKIDGNYMDLELHHMQCVAIGAKIYVISPWTGAYPREKTLGKNGLSLVYNTENDSWGTLAGLNGRARGGGAVVVYAGQIYLAGGNRGGHGPPAKALTWVDRYNPKTNTWQALGDMTGVGRDHTGGAVVGNQFCVLGGRNGGASNFWGANIDTIQCMNMQTGRWRQMKSKIAIDRAGSATGATCDGYVMLAGGEGRKLGQKTGGRAWATVDLFDPFADKIVQAPNVYLRRARHGTGLCVAPCKCGNIYIPSGSGNLGGSPELYSTEVFTPDGEVRPGSACV